MGWFKKKQDGNTPVSAQESDSTRPGLTFLGKNLTITGTISGTDNLQILGTCEGEIDVGGNVDVHEAAQIRGSLKAPLIQIKGSAEGDISAGTKLVLKPTAVIRGRIATPSISVEEGAVFDGQIKMK
jgi:cytoskeletal protein CcmA (bactofilin family)